MKKRVRFITALLTLAIVFSAFVPAGLAAEHKTGSELFGGVSKSEKDAEKLQEIYDDLICRAYEFDEDILLPNLEDMLDPDDIGFKYVQSKHGRARGQGLYADPDGKAKWVAKDGALVKVYAKYKDYSFVELMMNKEETEGTLGWIETTYLKTKWSPALSMQRAG